MHIYIYIYVSPCVSSCVVAQTLELVIRTGVLTQAFVRQSTLEQIEISLFHDPCV